MRIKLKYQDVETFIQKYAVNISKGGIFIATKTPKAVGTPLRFEFVLADTGATAVIRGEGAVQWVKEFDATQPQKAHGMGIKFTKLDPESQTVVDRALAFRQRDQSQTGLMPEPPTRPKMPLPASFDSETVSGQQPTVVIAPVPTVAATAPAPVDATPPPIAPPPVPANPPPVTAPPVAANPPPVPRTVAGPAIHHRDHLNGTNAPDLEALARSSGLSDEQIARALARPREPLSEADLDSLLEVPEIAVPTVAAAIAELRRLLG